MPFTRAIDKQMNVWAASSAMAMAERAGGALRSECIWLQFWVELPTAADAAQLSRISQ